MMIPGGKVLRGDEVAAEASPWQAETLGRKGDAFFKQHDNGAGGSGAATSELAHTPCSDELQGEWMVGRSGVGKGQGCCTTHPSFCLPKVTLVPQSYLSGQGSAQPHTFSKGQPHTFSTSAMLLPRRPLTPSQPLMHRQAEGPPGCPQPVRGRRCCSGGGSSAQGHCCRFWGWGGCRVDSRHRFGRDVRAGR